MNPSARVKGVVSAIVLIAGAGAVSCRQPMPPPTRVTVRLATGLPGMTFKPLGEALVNSYRRVLPDIDFVVVETEGSVSNLEHLDTRKAELGLALADVAYMGYNGHIPELPDATRHVRGIAVLHPSTVHVLVRKNTDIKSLADLRGRRLGIGPPGSGTAVTSAMLLQAFGVPLDAVRQRALPFREATDALIGGDLDAVFIAAADPVPAVRRATQSGASLLEVTGTTVEQLRRQHPFLRPATIAADTYPGQPDPVRTVRVDVLLLCRDDLDDVLVHRLTAALFEVLPELVINRDYLKLVDVRRAPATPLPLHAGAAWYYREQELLR